MMTVNSPIQNIEQTLEHLKNAINSEAGLRDFEAVKIPFELTQACIQLLTDCFSIPMLQTLANDDSETLEAWAIAFNTTLQVQLGVLSRWLPLLSSSSLPSKLREKAAKRTAELKNIVDEKAALLQTASTLFAQETELHQRFTELSELREKFEELKTIELDINSTDIDNLRAEVVQKGNELIPQKQAIEELHQQKAELETQMTSLHQQGEILGEEIRRQQEKKQRQESAEMSQIKQLIDLTDSAKIELSITLKTALEELDSKRNEYNQEWEQLQQTLTASNLYQAEIQSINNALHAHYQADVNLGERLPVERHRIEALTETIREHLAELDRELKTAHAHHEHLQKKQYITFTNPL
ncbi:MAG: hypothetical protein WBB43_09375 [Limnoraphis sp.]